MTLSSTSSQSFNAQKSPLIAPFYPALDGLRAIAFLMVFSVHYGFLVSNTQALKWGWTGVDLFFVLSGFLITGILYDSLTEKDFFRGFYVRRILRIFPLFYGFWAILFLLTPVFHILWNRYLFASIAYMGNVFYPSTYSGSFSDPFMLPYSSPLHRGVVNAINLSHLWTLCVEEQFYLVWPAVVWLVRKRETLLWLCLAWIVAIPIGRELYNHWYFSTQPSAFLYMSTIARSDTLIMGAALALWLRGPVPSPEKLHRAAYIAITAAPLMVAWLYCHSTHPREAIENTQLNSSVSGLGYSLIGIAAIGVLVLAIDPKSPLAKLLQNRVLVHLGRISYGLYFFHFLPLGFIVPRAPWLKSHHLNFVTIAALLLLTLALAELSFRYWESPFLRLKSRLAPRPGQVSDPPPEPWIGGIPVEASSASPLIALSILQQPFMPRAGISKPLQ